MSAVDYSEYQRAVEWMEEQEARRLRISLVKARPHVARATGLSPGTLENIARGRLKGLQGRVERAIDAALVKFLQRQHDGIAHELELANARLGRVDRGVLARAEVARDALAALIEEAR